MQSVCLESFQWIPPSGYQVFLSVFLQFYGSALTVLSTRYFWHSSSTRTRRGGSQPTDSTSSPKRLSIHIVTKGHPKLHPKSSNIEWCWTSLWIPLFDEETFECTRASEERLFNSRRPEKRLCSCKAVWMADVFEWRVYWCKIGDSNTEFDWIGGNRSLATTGVCGKYL